MVVAEAEGGHFNTVSMMGPNGGYLIPFGVHTWYE